MATSEFDYRTPIYKTVNDTRLARKMFPDFKDNGDGTLAIIDGYKENGLSHMNRLFKEVYASQVSNMVPNNVKIIGTPKK